MYKLSIVTPEKFVFEDDVISTILPGVEGYFEILTNHAAIITSLKPGVLTITDKNRVKLVYAVSGGIIEMFQNQATLLADSIESPKEIDFDQAEKAYERARKRIESKEQGLDIARAKQAMKRAENRMNVYHQYQELEEAPHPSGMSFFE